MDTLEEGKCYEIDGAVVKKYGDVKYLAFGKELKRIVGDIREVEEKEVGDDGGSDVCCVEGEISCVVTTKLC